MTLPNFLVIGAHKGGTTSLYAHLAAHPQVFMSPHKEPRYFALAGDPCDFRGPDDPDRDCAFTELPAYEALFAAAGGARAVGEASTLYLYDERAAPAIRRAVPDARLVAILRDPVDRAWSNFVFARLQGREPLADFAAALAAEEERIAGRWGPLWHYAAKGFYDAQLERYARLFPPEQLLVVLYDDLRRDPAALAQRVYAFLGIDPGFCPDTDVQHNPSGVPRSRWLHRLLQQYGPLRSALARPIPERLRARLLDRVRRANLARPEAPDPAVREALRERFRDDLERLEDRIGRDLSAWRAPRS